ncbi:MAG: histidine phosphatase family protein [Gammaproteobacteria bacterium]
MRETVKKSTRVIFVRHGQADFPTDRLYCDDSEDPALSELGQQQARNAAELLHGIEVDQVIVSAWKRTMMTAEAINQVLKAPLSTTDRLRERPFGVWDGLYFKDIERDFPEDFRAWKADQVNYVPEGGETIPELRERVNTEINSIIQAHLGKTIVVVAHVGPIRVMIADAIGLPLANYRQLNIDYASISQVDYGQRLNNLIYLNRL